KAIAVYESIDDGELELIKCYAWVALDASNRGDRALAEKLYARVIDVWERRGLLRSVSMVHSDLSIAAWLDDDEDGARHHVAQAEAIARRVAWRPALYSALQQRALVEARWGSVELAASGLTEALANTPPAHSNYIWMYVANALGVMIRMEDWDRAALLMATIDQTFHRNGWPP